MLQRLVDGAAARVDLIQFHSYPDVGRLILTTKSGPEKDPSECEDLTGHSICRSWLASRGGELVPEIDTTTSPQPPSTRLSRRRLLGPTGTN
jgi:hypothetical protein